MNHISSDQIQAWLDERVIRDIQQVSEDTTEYNFQLRLSRLPLHVIKEDTWGPLRIVGRSGFDTDRTAALVESAAQRQQLLTSIGPVLAATPGFYVFFDEEEQPCEFADIHQIQLEQRIYPNEANQQALMSGLMAIATAMRYIQNMAAVMQSTDTETQEAAPEKESPDGAPLDSVEDVSNTRLQSLAEEVSDELSERQ